MAFFKKLIDVFTLGSNRPVLRLIVYYVLLAVVVIGLAYAFPSVDRMMGGSDQVALVRVPQLLQDGLIPGATPQAGTAAVPDRLTLAVSTTVLILATLVLMLPVSWVYMSTQKSKQHNQQLAQTLIYLPMVVAGVVLVVQNSLALAFSLAGVVAAVRFRTTLQDARDVVFIFLAIAVGFAAGVQSLIIAAVVSVSFNFLLILTWRYDFGRSVLEPTATSSKWAQPLLELAGGNGKIPDRDLVMALDQKSALALSDRFNRVRLILGPSGKKPRYNAILSVTTNRLSEAEQRIGDVLDEMAGRWRLDEVVTNSAKPSELYYLVRLGKRTGRDDVLTAVRAKAGPTILSAEVELGGARQADDEKAKAKSEKKG